MADLETTIQQLEEKLKQAKARKAKIDARRRATEAKKQRQEDTRRKVLIGAVMLAEMKQGSHMKPIIEQMLNAGLTKEADRALFDLPPKTNQTMALVQSLYDTIND